LADLRAQFDLASVTTSCALYGYKDAPDFRRTQKIGRIEAIPILCGFIFNTFEFRFWIGTGVINPVSLFSTAGLYLNQ
jgi:hypothetical protein